jgi:Tfp pilus assembly protein FimV
MELSSSAGYASAISTLQTRSQLQVGQLQQANEQQQQAAQALQTGTAAAPGGNTTADRGSIVNILA